MSAGGLPEQIVHVEHVDNDSTIITLDDRMPQAWRDLIIGLATLSTAAVDTVSPLHCEHDTLTVMADPGRFTPDALAELDELGFADYGDDVFTSFRFGSA